MYKFLPLRSSADCIDDLHDAMQGRISSDGHVRSTEVVIDRTHESHNVQMGVLLSQRVCDFPLNTKTASLITDRNKKTYFFLTVTFLKSDVVLVHGNIKAFI